MKKTARKYSLTIIALAMVCGCNPALVPLKGNYSNQPVEITSGMPADSIWLSVRNIFTANGLPIKTIDKQKGLITTKTIPVNAIYTFEDNNGLLEQPQAWIVLTKVFNKKKEWKPKEISSQWSVQITETGQGTTTVKIDPIIMYSYFANSFTHIETRGQSTGKFEQLLKSSLKNN